MISARNLSFALVTTILAVVFSMSAAAQDSGTGQQTAPQREGGRRGGPGGGRGDREGGGMMRMLADLNLTDAQKQQVQGILKSSNETNRPKQEEVLRLRQQSEQGTLSADDQAKLKQLQADVRAARQKTHEDIVAVLTPEQQAKLKEIEQQRKANRPGGEGRGQNAPPQ
jgi:Spy/CpxP family protein refolding chaperone